MRTRKSCDACHSRKIKCDLALPKCDWCFHRKISCTVLHVPRQATAPAPSSPGEPVQTRPGTSGNTPSTPLNHDTLVAYHHHQVRTRRPGPLPSGVHFGRLHFAGRDLGTISSSNGIPFFSDSGREWILSCAGEAPVFPDLPEDLLIDAWAQTDDIELSLPRIDVVEDYLSFFSNSHLKLEFPVIDSVTFRDTILAAYGLVQDVPPHERMLAKASVFAFLALLSFFEGERRPPARRVDGDICALKARCLLSASPQDLGVTTLQTALMLSIHLLFSGQIALSSVYHSLACRIMFMLGGHLLADPWSAASQPTDDIGQSWTLQGRRHLRKLFWVCYIWDKEISLRTGHPPAIADEHCDLTLPSGYQDILYRDEYPFGDVIPSDESAVPLLPGDPQLNMIKSKAATMLYSAQALRKSDGVLLRDIRELDEELESWRLSIAPKYRPVLSVREPTAGFGGDKPKSVRTVMMDFDYHYLMATIHQATSRCSAWTTRESREIDSVRSSLALAVEASRSTLVSLRSVVHGLLDDATWTIVFYPMSAVVTIFCNVLWDPLHPRASEDVRLLESSPELIRRIRRRRMTDSEMLHLRTADEFLAELVRLARCAINKARREQDHLRYWG